MKKWFVLLLLLFAIGWGQPLLAQRFSVATNSIEYFNLGTLNAETACAVARRVSIHAAVRYNPFQFHQIKAGKVFQNKTQSYALGTRFWPWHVYSGWWFSGKVQYQEYNVGGIVSKTTREGDRWGAGLGVGYSHMLGRHLNLDFGLKIWAGRDVYKKYACPVCGLTLESGKCFFFLPDELVLAVSYIF